MSAELKAWLEMNGFDQFVDKLKGAGVESLDDLKILQTDAEILELVGPQGINMGVVFRRKFIKAVFALKEHAGQKVQFCQKNTYFFFICYHASHCDIQQFLPLQSNILFVL